MWICIVAPITVLAVAGVVAAAIVRRRGRRLPRQLTLTLWTSAEPTDEAQAAIGSYLQLLLDMYQEVTKGPDVDRLERLTPLALYNSPGVNGAILELALVDHFDEEIGAMAPTVERTINNIAAILEIDPSEILFRFDRGPAGTPAPPGPCLNGGPSFDEMFPAMSRAAPPRS